MDNSHYKDLTTSRGFNYHYYLAKAQDNKPTLLFLHGFPSSSYDWRYQVVFFEAKGYGLIVPDLLGYGGTSKPVDPSHYAGSLVCKDVIDILDAEKASDVIPIGHDWGCKIASYLLVIYPTRFIGLGLLDVGFAPPNPVLDYQATSEYLKKVNGYDTIGYWLYFSEDGTDKAIEKNFESFYSILMADDPTLWLEHFAPAGGLKKWIEANRQTPYLSYMPKEEVDRQKDIIRTGGLIGPLSWYKAKILDDIDRKDAQNLALASDVSVQVAVFFAGALKDIVVSSSLHIANTARHCKNLTTKEFNTSHWIMWEAKDDINKELEAWIEATIKK